MVGFREAYPCGVINSALVVSVHYLRFEHSRFELGGVNVFFADQYCESWMTAITYIGDYSILYNLGYIAHLDKRVWGDCVDLGDFIGSDRNNGDVRRLPDSS